MSMMNMLCMVLFMGSHFIVICWVAEVLHICLSLITITLFIEHNHAGRDQHVTVIVEHSYCSTDDIIRSLYVLFEVRLSPLECARNSYDFKNSASIQVLVGEGVSMLIDGKERVELVISLGICTHA